MPIKPTTQVSSVGSQRDRRYTDTFRDQHRSPRFPEGRPWWGEREFAANKPDPDGFCSTLTPGDHEDPLGSAWDAPWMPPQQSTVQGGSYFDLNYRKRTIVIRYDIIVRDDTDAFRKYYDAAAVIAYEKGWQPPEFGTLPRQAIRAVIGQPPRSPKVAQAAQAGDPWLLGHAKEVNEELAALLGLTKRGIAIAFASQEAPVATPEQVLAADPGLLKQMMAQMEAMQTELKELRAKDQKREQMAAARAARGKSTTATPDAA